MNAPTSDPGSRAERAYNQPRALPLRWPSELMGYQGQSPWLVRLGHFSRRDWIDRHPDMPDKDRFSGLQRRKAPITWPSTTIEMPGL